MTLWGGGGPDPLYCLLLMYQAGLEVKHLTCTLIIIIIISSSIITYLSQYFV